MKFLGIKLVTDWRTAMKMWSMRLNAVAALVITYVLMAPDVLLQILNALPPELRATVPPFVGVALFLVVAVIRLAKQKNLDGSE